MTLLQSSWSIARQLCTPASAIIGQSAALATQLTQSYANISEAQRRSQPGASTSQPQPFKRITKRQFAKLQLQQSHPAFAAFNASSARVAQALPLNDDELVKQHATAPNLYHGVQDWHMDFARVLRRYNYSLPSLPGQVIIARVLRITGDRLFVDPEFHHIAELPLAELDVSHVHMPAEGQPLNERSSMSDFRVGDMIRVKVDHIYTPYGDMQLEPLTQDPKMKEHMIWGQLAGMQAARKPVYGRVLNQCNGGYAVGVAGIVAHLPYASATAATAQKIGQLEPFLIVELDERRKKIVLRDAKLPGRKGRL